MHTHEIDDWRHDHNFLGHGHGRNARRIGIAIALSFAVMLIEIGAGKLFGSMALLADGMHMATHVGAFGIAAAAYAYARKHQGHPRFAFGTGKVGDLAAFASAVVLTLMAALVACESIERCSSAEPIQLLEAILVAILGLVVNIVTAFLLHSDGHHHHHGHGAHHDDHNHRAAYMHVLADALTSVLAIAGLVAAALLGWTWLDPVMGVVGALIIGKWSIQLMKESGSVLLDAGADPLLPDAIRARVETAIDRVADLHVWRVGPGHTAAILTMVSSEPKRPEDYKARISDLHQLCHVTVEVRLAA